MQIVADLHTHTNVSSHAYSTLAEIVHAAKEAGMLAIALTAPRWTTARTNGISAT